MTYWQEVEKVSASHIHRWHQIDTTAMCSYGRRQEETVISEDDSTDPEPEP